MRKTQKMTPAMIEEACALREEGWSCPAIAKKFSAAGTPVSDKAVYWHCLTNGADLPVNRRRPTLVRAGAVEKRGNHVVRRYTPAEDNQLLDLEAQGLGYSAIGRKLGRKPNSIRGRLATLARLEDRREAM